MPSTTASVEDNVSKLAQLSHGNKRKTNKNVERKQTTSNRMKESGNSVSLSDVIKMSSGDLRCNSRLKSSSKLMDRSSHQTNYAMQFNILERKFFPLIIVIIVKNYYLLTYCVFTPIVLAEFQ